MAAYRYYDQKVKGLNKLSKPMQEELFFDLITAFSLIKSAEDSALFIQDLLTDFEVKILSKRLRIAKLLMKGEKYEDIMIGLHTSRATIAKVGSWLAERGEGFKRVVGKLPELEKVKSWEDKSYWEQMASRYPRYFWPLLSDGEGKKARVQKQREHLGKVLEGLGKKESIRRKIQERADEYYKERWEEKKRDEFHKKYPTPRGSSQNFSEKSDENRKKGYGSESEGENDV